MSRSALLLLLVPPLTVPLLELPLVLVLEPSLPLLPLLPPLDELLELEPELLPPSQLPPWEARAPVRATTAIPKTATARTWRSFTFNPVEISGPMGARLDGRTSP